MLLAIKDLVKFLKAFSFCFWIRRVDNDQSYAVDADPGTEAKDPAVARV